LKFQTTKVLYSSYTPKKFYTISHLPLYQHLWVFIATCCEKKVNFLFLNTSLRHLYEVTRKIIILYTPNTFFTCKRTHLSCLQEVSRFVEQICYFLSFKWISTCLSKIIPSWTMFTSNKIQKIPQKLCLGYYLLIAHI
jgi:hypothetical protein